MGIRSTRDSTPPSAAPEPTGRGRLPGTFAALKNPNYRMFWFGMLASMTAMQMQQIARGYLAFDLTGKATAVGLVSVAWAVPQILFSLFGGVVADRVEKRNLLMITQSLTGLLALITAILLHTGVITITHLVLLGIAQGTVFAFNMPARQSLVPELVGQQDLMNAIALNNAGMNFTRIFGPSLAGLIIASDLIGLTGVYYLNASLYIVYIAFISKIPVTGSTVGRKKAPMVAEFRDGIRYIRTHSMLPTLLTLGFLPIILGMSYQSMLPVISKRVFDAGSQGLGFMAGAAGLGALIGSLVVASLTSLKRKALLQLAMGMAFGFSLILFSLAPNLIAAMAVLLLVGGAATFYQTLNNTLVMTSTDAAYQGRVMSVYMISMSLMPLSALPVGIIVDHVGARPTLGFAGAAVAAVVAAVTLLHPRYRRMETIAPVGGRAVRAGSNPGIATLSHPR
ncbi:MAG: MFS transporter [Chloroflexi bacterium]|nr:MFS transporter [Chloroflexota bacterium]